MEPRERISIPRGSHFFVDETKAREFIMVGVWVGPGQLEALRRVMRGLVPSGAHRVHAKKLNDSQRRSALAALSSAGIGVAVVRVTGGSQRAARTVALAALLQFATLHDVARVIIEADATFVRYDTRVVAGSAFRGEVIHRAAREDPALWASDLIAWAVQRGTPWAQAVEQRFPTVHLREPG